MKTKKEIVFRIDADNYIDIKLSDLQLNLTSVSGSEISFCGPKKNILIFPNKPPISAMVDAAEILHVLLGKALSCELDLPDSMSNDIGYLWNEELQDKPDLEYDIIEGRKYWKGLHYLLWSPKCKTATWLYNKDGKIFFEITPVYPWHFSDPEPGENYYSYDEFIKNYKPLVIIEIAKETAQQWLRQTEELLSIVEKNDAQYLEKEIEK